MKEIDYSIIWKVLNAAATEKEQQELDEWLNDQPQNRAYYQRLLAHNQKQTVDIQPNEVEAEWQKLHTHIQSTKKVRRFTWLKYAAVAIPFFIALSFWLFNQKPADQIAESQTFVYENTEVSLTLGNGKTVTLDKANQHILDTVKSIQAVSDSTHQLTYSNNLTEASIEFNTLSVPRGGFYKVQLADGTIVWLNSATELRYPTSFPKATRDVYLQGEAIFEVSKDKTKPFIVHTNQSNVKVYGTVFNVMSYPDDNKESTTLVEGSVSVEKNGEEYMIEPGEQSTINNDNDSVEIKPVDVNLYTSWKEGIYRFEKTPLIEIATKLERWYNVKFVFKDEASKNKIFTGALLKETSYSFFMELIEEATNVKITIDDHTIYVESK